MLWHDLVWKLSPPENLSTHTTLTPVGPCEHPNVARNTSLCCDLALRCSQQFHPLPSKKENNVSRHFPLYVEGFCPPLLFHLVSARRSDLSNWQALRTDFRKCSQRVVGGKHLSMRCTMTHICALISFLYHPIIITMPASS